MLWAKYLIVTFNKALFNSIHVVTAKFIGVTHCRGVSSSVWTMLALNNLPDAACTVSLMADNLDPVDAAVGAQLSLSFQQTSRKSHVFRFPSTSLHVEHHKHQHGKQVSRKRCFLHQKSSYHNWNNWTGKCHNLKSSDFWSLSSIHWLISICKTEMSDLLWQATRLGGFPLPTLRYSPLSCEEQRQRNVAKETATPSNKPQASWSEDWMNVNRWMHEWVYSQTVFKHVTYRGEVGVSPKPIKCLISTVCLSPCILHLTITSTMNDDSESEFCRRLQTFFCLLINLIDFLIPLIY